MAGVTIWAVLVPSALSYGPLAGVDPAVGLIGVPLALIGYALFGGSKILVVGADAAVSVLVGATLASVGAASKPSAMISLSLLVGLLFVVMRLARLGWLADVVPTPVLKGFIAGLAVTTSIGQIPDLLGYKIPKTTGTLDKVRAVIDGLGGAHAASAALGLGALVVLLIASRVVPKAPSAMAVLIITGFIVAIAGLAKDGVAVVGAPKELFSGSLSGFSFDGSLVWNLIPGALAIVVLGFTESLGANQIASEYNGEPVDPNKELLGLGAGNIGVGLGGSFAVTGALSKTAVAVSSGARTQLANIVVAVLAVLTALFLRPLFEYLASPVLAGMVVWAMIGTIDVGYLRRLRAGNVGEFAVALAAAGGVLMFGVMPGVVAATVLALLLLTRHVVRPPSERLVRTQGGRWEDETTCADGDRPSDFAVVRQDGPLVFVNARVAGDHLLDIAGEPGVDLVILDASTITAIDSTAVTAIDSAVKRMANDGVQFWVAGTIERVQHRLALLSNTKHSTLRFFDTVDQAAAAWRHDHPVAPASPDGE